MMVDQTGHVEDLPLARGMDLNPILDEELLRWITEAEYLGVSRETAVLIATKRRALKLNRSSQLKVTTNSSIGNDCFSDGSSSSIIENGAANSAMDNKCITRTEISSNSSKCDVDYREEYEEEDYVNNVEYDSEIEKKNELLASSICVVSNKEKVGSSARDAHEDLATTTSERFNTSEAALPSVSLSQLSVLDSGFKNEAGNAKNSNDTATSFSAGLLDKIVNTVITNSALNSYQKLKQKRRKKKSYNNNNSSGHHQNNRRKRPSCHRQQNQNSLFQTDIQFPVIANPRNKEDGKCGRSISCFGLNPAETGTGNYSVLDASLMKQNKKLSNASMLREIVEKDSKTAGEGGFNLRDDNSSVDTTMGVVNSGFDKVDKVGGFSSALDAIVAAHTCNPFNNYQNHGHSHSRVQGNSRARRKRRYHNNRNSNVQNAPNCTEKSSSCAANSNVNTGNAATCVGPSGLEEKRLDAAASANSNSEQGIFQEPARIACHRNSRRQLYGHRKHVSQSLQSHQTSFPSSATHHSNRSGNVETKVPKQTINPSNNASHRAYPSSKRGGGPENASSSARPRPKKAEAVEHVREQLRISFRSRGVLGV
ncbi:hypothetical protein FG386_002190 [Cryptosporidium ryanae]|uniref:uncharacterized protein n=1 Tax=Cryptosporidium ryanae TaxID=515981 RepID=UPI00351A2815|nr:hypothetical protein FG386_002190 [Cryptosporidium ryanae]